MYNLNNPRSIFYKLAPNEVATVEAGLQALGLPLGWEPFCVANPNAEAESADPGAYEFFTIALGGTLKTAEVPHAHGEVLRFGLLEAQGYLVISAQWDNPLCAGEVWYYAQEGRAQDVAALYGLGQSWQE